MTAALITSVGAGANWMRSSIRSGVPVLKKPTSLGGAAADVSMTLKSLDHLHYIKPRLLGACHDQFARKPRRRGHAATVTQRIIAVLASLIYQEV